MSTLDTAGARFALIGGLALASHRVVRATSDVDLLTDAGGAEHLREVREYFRLFDRESLLDDLLDETK